MKKKKGKSILMVVGIIAVAVILANWVVPGSQDRKSVV